MMQRDSPLKFDLYLMIATLALIAIGILFIYSSGVTSDGTSFSREWLRQIVWAVLGLVLLTTVAFVDYGRLRDLAPYLYVALMLLLVFTLAAGRVVNGARSWLGVGDLGIQPSEFAKPATIIFLAYYLERRGTQSGELWSFVLGFGIALAPVGLILLQPDLGTATVYVPVYLAMAFAAGTRVRYIMFILFTAILLVVLTVLPAWEQLIHQQEVAFVRILTDRALFTYVLGAFFVVAVIGIAGRYLLKKRYFGWVIYSAAVVILALLGSVAARRVLQDYQLMRLIVFLDPGVDPRGAGWNIIQSVTAVGSGGLSGKGWLQGTQSHLQYLPQQSTDFIFSILAEEWGFLGALGVFACFLVIILRGLLIGSQAKDNFAAYLAVGLVTMIFFHAAVNVGMAIGIMPITGIPLFFLSYGGSSLWTALIAVGLLLSVFQHRYRY
jgi:rod shape determining protein RodA